MKQPSIFILTLAFIVFGHIAISQDSISCNLQEIYYANHFLSGSCSPDQNGDWETYRNMNTYIPDMNPDHPLQNPPISTIQINFNIIQKDDGSGNFPNNQATNDRLKAMIEHVNSFYEHYAPSDPISWVTELPNFDSRIRFSLGEPGNERIYFYQNTAAWNDTWPTTTIEPFIAQNYPERLEQVNVYIFGNPNNNNWAHATMPSWTDFNSTSWVVLFYWENPGSDWSTSGTLAHEFGHNLDLLHTYHGGGASAICDQQDEDFLKDVFLIQLPDISNCPHTGSWSDDPYLENGDGITNNLLGGTQSQKYISPMQAGQMHRSLAITSVRKYVKCDKSQIPLVINGIQNWDFDMKLYRDLIISPNSHLTISCHLVMHPDAKIVIEPGGKLTIDGGLIGTDIFEKAPWAGIEVWGNSAASQYPDANGNYQQGYVELKNGAVIENAWEAIQPWHPGEWNETGG
ncbi:MAG TPA: hypothetical protein ENH23_07925, partial [candidate division Zixibacteria bacterium]|nr:hypothetical protein [candidate division Zixibacteria bacterium]